MITLFLGLIVGVLFGLTGNGGSTLAVPLLVYGLHQRPHAAVCTSMIAVGAMAAVRAVQSTRAESVDNQLGWRLAFGGLAGAPIGVLIGRHLSERWLLMLFAALVLIVAVRLWIQKAHIRPDVSSQSAAQRHRHNSSGCSQRWASAQECFRDCSVWEADSS